MLECAFTTECLVWEKTWKYLSSVYKVVFFVSAKLISAFVFATRIVHFLLYLTPKFQTSRHLLCLYSPVCVRPVLKPHCWFSHEAAHLFEPYCACVIISLFFFFFFFFFFFEIPIQSVSIFVMNIEVSQSVENCTQCKFLH